MPHKSTNYHHLTMIYRLTKPINQTWADCRVPQFPHTSTCLHQSLHDHCCSSHKAGITFRIALSRSFLVYKYSSINRCLCCSRRHISHASWPVFVSFVFASLIAFSSSYFLSLEKPVIPRYRGLLQKFFCRFAHLFWSSKYQLLTSAAS